MDSTRDVRYIHVVRIAGLMSLISTWFYVQLFFLAWGAEQLGGFGQLTQ